MHVSIFSAYLQIGVQRHWGAGPCGAESETVRMIPAYSPVPMLHANENGGDKK